MTEQHKQFPEFYVTASQSCPYVPGRSERKLFTHLTHDKPVALVDTLLRGGFRRSQNIAYMPYCEGCRACVPVRVQVDEFEPGRTMRRVLRRNGDLVSRRIPATPTSEQYALFRSYIEHRHGDGGMADMSVLDFAMMIEDSIIETFITEYRLRPSTPDGSRIEKWPLLAVALCDRLSDGVSMVYSFYDPLCDDRSLGTLMILDHIQHTKALGLPYLYLGYWIQESRKMRYKSRFTPLQVLGPNGWVPRELPQDGGD
jgi:arginine-tRNA-protein transferase